ncbi:MAG: tRNA (guanosine(46)-N7)-methyltransferase TrmB [Planctomycetaceae bacterium]|nr:tRNA (guanosine(46)-N7)-methyltransferase TrmB [Planctomycetaceae bacterium]
MGRRTLRRIDPRIDLRGYLHVLEQFAVPYDMTSLFDHLAPLEIEVGSGKGLFLDTAAAQFPGHNYLGIEMARRYARYTAARLARGQRSNARILEGDAEQLFEQFLESDQVHAVHVYFPDPWWKKRHHKRRVMNDRFLRNVQRVLAPAGRLHFWTDVQDYYERTVERIAAATSLQGPEQVRERPVTHDLDYRTHFERRTRLQKLPVYRAEFVAPGMGPPRD